MIGKILGGILGEKASKGTSSVSGPGGAILGMATATLLKRLSLPAMIVLGAGGYALKKWHDKKEADEERRKSFDGKPEVSPSAT